MLENAELFFKEEPRSKPQCIWRQSERGDLETTKTKGMNAFIS